MKLAILLLCHKNPEQINLFLDTLRHPDIEFFIHVDKKSDIVSQIKSRSDVHILSDKLRIDVRWGEFSQSLATRNLFAYAFFSNTNFDYFWLCSGQDFPIKSAEYIINWLNQHRSNNFISFSNTKNLNGGKETNSDKRNIIYYPHFLMGRTFCKRLLKRIYVCITGGYTHTFQIFRRRDKFSQLKSYFGPNWMCLRRDFVKWGLEFIKKNSWYEKHLRNSTNPDESYWQTLFMMSPYAGTQHEYLHYIDWTGCKNSPNILTVNDYARLRASKYLMARKFDITVDSKIIEILEKNAGND